MESRYSSYFALIYNLKTIFFSLWVDNCLENNRIPRLFLRLEVIYFLRVLQWQFQSAVKQDQEVT